MVMRVGPVQLLLSASAGLVAYGIYKLASRLLRPFFSPLRIVPGPPNPSILFGHFRELASAELAVKHEEWVQQYGSTIKYKGFMNSDRLLTLDLKALNHILQQSNIYHKPHFSANALSVITGEGLLVAEGQKHRAQRRVLNPAFGPTQIRQLTSVFLDKANELCYRWSTVIANEKCADPMKPVRIDAISWLQRTTFDIIGLSGFGHEFNALSTENNEFNTAMLTVFGSAQRAVVWEFLYRWIPFFRIISSKRAKKTRFALESMKRIGRQLVADKKAEVQSGATKQTVGQEKDLLSLLIRANMDKEVPESQRMSDADVLAQIPTFLVAGLETVATATTWVLHALSINPELQSRLRAELLTSPLPRSCTVLGDPAEALSQEELSKLNALPLLDAVLRETLRLQAPAPSTFRVATHEDEIPLNEPFTGSDGKIHESIRVAKGDLIFIPLLMINRSKAIWGDDAHEFKPERWLDSTSSISTPGIWGNLMSFLGGPHACIGFRFAIIEVKILLHALLTSFSFELAVPKEVIARNVAIVQRPYVRSEREKGNQMPLLVTPVPTS